MRYVDEFRNRHLVNLLAGEIRAAVDARRTYRFMEVCGTHTMSIFRFGLKSLIPGNISLLSGPGCPVCVTPNSFLDKAIAISRLDNVIITTFGDMLKVPGSYSSLEKEKAGGSSIKIVYSTDDALDIACKNPDKEVVFLGVGFETTSPTVAQSIVSAAEKNISNYSVLCGHKTMPEALSVILSDKGIVLDGLLLPGHVSAIIGTRPYEILARRYKKNCVVAGFEPVDIMQAILMLIKQRSPRVEIQYTRVIKSSGNHAAKRIIDEVFYEVPSEWRGMGSIKNSGLVINKKYSAFDASKKFDIGIQKPREDKRCICGEVLRGRKLPTECQLFAKVCTPVNPVGACMVSSEGACAAYYKYGSK